MVRIDRVHTGGGDSGESSLVDGSRRSKSDARFSVVGDCDELNSLPVSYTHLTLPTILLV